MNRNCLHKTTIPVNNTIYPFNEWTIVEMTVKAVDWPRTIYIVYSQ